MVNERFFLRRRDPSDDPALVELFNRSFAVGDPDFRARDLAWWRWKYGENPAGAQNVVVEDDSGAVVGHYGGVPMRVRTEGGIRQFGQNCDCFIDERFRRGLKNPGLVVRMAQAYASTYGGVLGSAVMYGIGTATAYRLGARHLDYWMLRTQPLLVCRDGRRLPAWDEATHAVENDRFDARADAFATSTESAYRCVGRRDAAFLNWRFKAQPDSPYGSAFAKSGDRDDYRGHVVYRIATLAQGRLCVIADWFVRPDDDGAARSLLRRAVEFGARRGAERIGFLCPVAGTWFRRFQEWGFVAEPSGYVMCARPYDEAITSAYLREHWWYTFADFDVV